MSALDEVGGDQPPFERCAAGAPFRSVVHVNEKGGRFGGTEEYLDLITPALAARGVRSHLVCGRVVSDVASTFETVDVVAGLAARTPSSGTTEAVVERIESLDADVVYLHNLFDPAIVMALAGGPRRGVLLWYVHDHYVTCLSELRLRRDLGACGHRLGESCLAAIGQGLCVLRDPERPVDIGELRQRRALSDAMNAVDGVIVVSDYMRGLLGDAQPALGDRVHHVDRPIRDLGLATVRTRSADAPATITFAGRITPEKGLAVLIEALGTLRSNAPVELCVAGVVEQAEHWADCERLARQAMSTNPQLRVTALGHLDYAATDDLLRRSDIVAVPSQWPEPLGSVAVEAMSAGAAVIVSRIGGLANTVTDGDTGLLVEAGDPTAWAAAIDSVLADPSRARRLSRRARSHVQRHTTDAHIERLDGIVQHARDIRRAAS